MVGWMWLWVTGTEGKQRLINRWHVWLKCFGLWWLACAFRSVCKRPGSIVVSAEQWKQAYHVNYWQ